MKRLIGKNHVNLVALIVVGIGISLYPEIAAASAWETSLNKLINFLTGTTGKALAIIAVAVLGILALGGRLDVRFALSVIIGIAFIWGAAQIVDTFWQ